MLEIHGKGERKRIREFRLKREADRMRQHFQLCKDVEGDKSTGFAIAPIVTNGNFPFSAFDKVINGYAPTTFRHILDILASTLPREP